MSILDSKFFKLDPKVAKWGIVGSVVGILILTVMEFPPPIGFEARSQANVSPLWLLLFLAILIAEVGALVVVRKKPQLGANFAIAAGALNLLQIAADQLHLMQPDAIPLGYTLLELLVGVLSLVLIYFGLSLKRQSR